MSQAVVVDSGGRSSHGGLLPVVGWADGLGWLPAPGEVGAHGSEGLVLLCGDCLPVGVVEGMNWLGTRFGTWAGEMRRMGWRVVRRRSDRPATPPKRT